MKITDYLSYEKIVHLTGNTIHITTFKQECPHSSLLLSKISEAVRPEAENNHIGEGATLDQFLLIQKNVRFVINGGFNHYRKNFYDWKNQDFNIGDPVGIVKIRNHYFEDYLDLTHYGFFTQEKKSSLWEIKATPQITNKYILGCTPLLIYNGQKKDIPEHILKPVASGIINPPSVLGHGKQLHTRTAIGIKNTDIYFITVEGSPGMTLLELQELGLSLNLDSFLNLDGGGSSQFQLFHDGKYIKNHVLREDKERVLGHAIVIFDNSLTTTTVKS